MRVQKFARVLVLIALFLTLMSVAVEFASVALGLGNMRGSVPIFSLINEDSLGTWFSEVVLLSCSVLLMAIALSKKVAGDRYFFHWGVIGPLCVPFGRRRVRHSREGGKGNRAAHRQGYRDPP